jgi:hypothetical protein
MINQLIQYLRTEYPTYTFVKRLDPTDKQEVIVVRSAGGVPTGYPMQRVDQLIQIIVRSQDRTKSESRANEIYFLLKEKFDFTLDAVVELSEPAVNLAKIYATNVPGDFSQEGTGIYQFLINLTAIYSDVPVS